MRWGRVLAVISVLSLLGILLLLWMLPGPDALGRALRAEVHTTHIAAPSRTSPKDGEPRLESPTTPASQGSSFDKERQTSINRYFFGRYFDDPSGSNSKFYESLHEARASTDANLNQFNDELFQVADGKKSGDPYIESVLVPVGYLSSIPEVQKLFESLRSAIETNDSGLAMKASFYANIAAATFATWTNKSGIEAASDRGYLLYNLAKLLRERPDLIGSAKIGVLCKKIEIEGANKPIDESFREFSELLNLAGAKAEHIAFDPNYRTQIEVFSDGSVFTIKVPWINSMLKPQGTKRVN